MMIVEWFFLVSVMSGAFDPATEAGWQDINRSRHTYHTLAECELHRDAVYHHFRLAPIEGGGVVITGCQPIHVPGSDQIMRP